MTLSLAVADAVIPFSIYKPIVMLAVLVVWGRIVTTLDKDVAALYLNRTMWNGIQLGCGAAAYLIWFLLPLFWVGFAVALLVLFGPVVGYVMYRNGKVPEEQRWAFSPEMITGRISAARDARIVSHVALAFLNEDQSKRDVPEPSSPAFATHHHWQQALEFLLARGGERMDLIVSTEKVMLVATIDGVKHPIDPPDPRAGMAMLTYMKEQAGLDASDLRRRQSGAIGVDLGEDVGRHRLSVSTIGSTSEIRMTLLVDTEKRAKVTLDQLGLLESQRNALEPILGKAGGVVLVSSPPHHGTTALLYNLVEKHDPYTQTIVTLEDSIAYQIEGATHEQIEPGETAEGVSKRLVTLLRSDPGVVLLSKVTDTQIARIMADGAESVRFYAALPQSDTFTALRAWIKAVGDPKKAAESLTAIISERLVRRLCPSCRVAYRPDAAMLAKLNLPADRVKQLYKHSGKVLVNNREEVCSACHGLGYRGRVGVFEVMVLDDEARKLIAAAQLDQARAHLRKQRMLWLQEAALTKAVEGVTSLSEVQRVLAKESK